MQLIGRRLRFIIASGVVMGIERFADPTGKLFDIPPGESRLFNVLESMGVQTEHDMGAPKLNAAGKSLDQIVCFPEHFYLPGEDRGQFFR